MTGITFSDNECRMCGKVTTVGVNINLKLVTLCDDCASSIMIQQAKYLADMSVRKTEVERP